MSALSDSQSQIDTKLSHGSDSFQTDPGLLSAISDKTEESWSMEGVWTLLMIMTGSFQDSRGEGRWLLRGRKWRYFQSKYHPLRAVFAGLGTPQMGLGVKRAVTKPGRGDNHRVKAQQILTFCWEIFHSLLPSRPPLYHIFDMNPHLENFLALSWPMDKGFEPQFDTMTKENYCAGEKWSHFLWLISGGTWNKTPLSNFILSPGAPIIHETPIRSHFLPPRNWVQTVFCHWPRCLF